MTIDEDYSSYLQQRSRLGLLYRNYWLYPMLSRWLSGRILDVGCGIGDMLRYSPGAVGVDVNPHNVAICQADGLTVEVMPPDRLPFEPACFDSVVLDNVLEHIEDPRPLLAEIHRVLDDDGVLVVGVPGLKGYAADPDHKRYYDRAALVACLEMAGFEGKALRAMPFDCEWLSSKISQFCIYGAFGRV